MKTTSKKSNLAKVLSIFLAFALVLTVIVAVPMLGANAAATAEAGDADALTAALTSAEATDITLTSDITIDTSIVCTAFAKKIDLNGFTIKNNTGSNYAIQQVQSNNGNITFANSATTGLGGFDNSGSTKRFFNFGKNYANGLLFQSGTYNGGFSADSAITDGGHVTINESNVVFNGDVALKNCEIKYKSSTLTGIVFNGNLTLDGNAMGWINVGSNSCVSDTIFKGTLDVRNSVIVKSGSGSTSRVTATFEKDITCDSLIIDTQSQGYSYIDAIFMGAVNANSLITKDNGKQNVRFLGAVNLSGNSLVLGCTFSGSLNVGATSSTKLCDGTFNTGAINVTSGGYIKLLGGLYNFDPATNSALVLVDESKDNGDGTWTIVATAPLCKNTRTNEEYATLDAALSNENTVEGDTIQLVKSNEDYLMTASFGTVTKNNLTIDLNGFTLSDSSDTLTVTGSASGIVVGANVTLKIISSSTRAKMVKSVKADQWKSVVYVNSGSNVSIENVELGAYGSGNNGATIMPTTDCVVDINNCRLFSGIARENVIQSLGSNYTLSVTNSEIQTSSGSNAFSMAHVGSTKLKNCTVSGTISAAAAGADVLVDGCTLNSYSNGNVISAKNSTVTVKNNTTINAGTGTPIIVDGTTGVVDFYSGTVNASNSANAVQIKNTAALFNIYNGTFTSKTTFLNTPATYNACVVLKNGATAYDAETDGNDISATFASATNAKYVKVVSASAPTASFAKEDGTADAATSISATDITFPTYTTTKSGFQFVGWSDGTNLYAAGDTATIAADTEYTAVSIKITTADTAAVRWSNTTDKAGLKFTTQIAADGFATLFDLGSVSEASVGAEISKLNDFSANKINVKNDTSSLGTSAGWLNSTTDYMEFASSAANYDKSLGETSLIDTTLYARGYVTVTYADGGTATFYGAANAGASMKAIATAAYASADDAHKAILTKLYDVTGE